MIGNYFSVNLNYFRVKSIFKKELSGLLTKSTILCLESHPILFIVFIIVHSQKTIALIMNQRTISLLTVLNREVFWTSSLLTLSLACCICIVQQWSTHCGTCLMLWHSGSAGCRMA